MRLFGKLGGAIDRFFRAAWLTVPFDRAPARIAAAAGVCGAQACLPSSVAGQVVVGGPVAALAATPGAVTGQIGRSACV